MLPREHKAIRISYKEDLLGCSRQGCQEREREIELRIVVIRLYWVDYIVMFVGAYCCHPSPFHIDMCRIIEMCLIQ